MGTECFEIGINENGKHKVADAASCLSQTAFTLKRARSDASGNPGICPQQQVQTDADCSSGDELNFGRALRRRPWINYGKFDISSDDDSDCERSFQVHSPKPPLPKGVIRGCSRCNDCQKVTARWRPEDGRRPNLDEAPVFYPNEEEFKDTLKYIASIRAIAEPYGICRIVPPPSWRPPCPLRDETKWKSAKFPTRVQQIHKLQVREPMRKTSRNTNGGRRKRRRNSRVGRSCGRGQQCHPGVDGEHLASDEESRFGFDSGSEFTLEAFEKYANDFKEQYFGIQDMSGNLDSRVSDEMNARWEPSVENIEGDYWRVVEKPTEEIEVLYGADVETGVFGSGFPKYTSGTPSKDEDPFVKSGWNLNNFARLPGSVLSYEGADISGVLVPWLYLGMCFSSFCWHVEDHHFYSLNYMHWGAPKVWYGVPESAAVQLEQAMKKHLPDLFDEQPDLLHKLVTQLSPTILRSEGVPVYRSVQNAGEFVLTFPRAYHAGFNSGFNCAEAVNVAPVDWLPHGQSAVELYREQCRKTSVSHDKLLLGASREAVRSLWELLILRKSSFINIEWQRFCGQDGILTKALKMRVEMEQARRLYLANPAKTRKMEHNFDATKERECLSCYYDLHLSAVGCECCPERFACLEHAKKLCKCAWDRRFFLYRYDIAELDNLVEALGGNLNAIYRWATLDLGLSLSSCVSYPNTQSLNVSSQQRKMNINSLLGNSNTSFISMLNFASGANAGVVTSSAMQDHDNKLAASSPALATENDGPRVEINSETSLSSPRKYKILSCAPQSNAENAMTSSVQNQEGKLADCAPAKVEEFDNPQKLKKSENSVVFAPRDEIPDINQPCSFEENNLFDTELTSQAKTISDEKSPAEYFSYESKNKQNPFLGASKTEEHCSSTSEQLPDLNTRSGNTCHNQSSQECEPRFSIHKTNPNCQMKYMPGFPECRTVDDQEKSEPEARLRVQGLASANDVECIVLSDDEGSTGKTTVSEKKDEIMKEQHDVGKSENAHSYNRTAMGNLDTENVSYRTVHDTSGVIGQASERNKDVIEKIAQCGLTKLVNFKECIKDESHTNQFGLMRENDFSGSNLKSHGSKLSLFLDNALAQVRISNKFQTAQFQGLVHEENSTHSGNSMKAKVVDSTVVAGNSHSGQPYISTAADRTAANAVSGFDFSWNHIANERKAQSLFVSSSSDTLVNSTKSIQNKGPRIARVVRIQKCAYDIELVDVGVVSPCKSWYNSQTIFPKGFKSRVRFQSVLDPTRTCNYISEVLDAGPVGPLFKVIVEGCQTEAFTNITADKCWEMVQERLNQEIKRQRNLGKQNISAVQPPASLNGLEMFGFTSPSIIEAIEDLDRDHRCVEYWAARSSGTSKTYYHEKNYTLQDQNKSFNPEITKQSNTVALNNLLGMANSQHESSTVNLQQGQLHTENLVSSERVYKVLKELFKKASPDELWTMHKVLSGQHWSSNWRAAFSALVEELQNV